MSIHSGQHGPHRQLADVVQRHLRQPFRKPYAEHTLAAFRQTSRRVERHPGPLILDAGCGVGESTWRLAAEYPDALLLGVDKSEQRLAKPRPDAANTVYLRADLIDFWRLAVEAGWRPQRHYILYPNPWPKLGHLQRRWHGSAVFPAIVALGGELELRSNWEVYLREFAVALSLAGHHAEVARFQPDPPLTPFERKYQAAGQTLWRLQASLS